LRAILRGLALGSKCVQPTLRKFDPRAKIQAEEE
jgi:hypothetical protein